MTADSWPQLVDKLCSISRRDYVNPHEYLEWPERLDFGQWLMSPELISLYPTPLYAELTEPDRMRLSFFEAVNFFSLNIHGEKTLVEGLARRLYQRDKTEVTPYLHHFLDEENKHMVYFGGFCQRYAGRIYPDRKFAVPREYAPGEEDLLFFGKVLIFEEIVDVYNLRVARDERVSPIARQINLIHHREEARHLVFGREIVRRLAESHLPTWSDDTVRNVRAYLQDYLLATWKEYYNPDVYRDAGLQEPYAVRKAAFDSEPCRAHRIAVTERCLGYLRDNGLVEEGFQL